MGMTSKAWARLRGSEIRREKEVAKEKKKAYKPSSRGAEHKYKGNLVTPGSRAQRGSDSVQNTIRHTFNQDGSRVHFHQVWLDINGKGHSTRKAAAKCPDNPPGWHPHVDRYIR